MFRGKVMEGRVVKFTTKVTLKGFYGALKLSTNKGMKLYKFGEHLGFKLEGIDPYKLGKIVNKNQVILIVAFT